jgi:hypothetical protein
MKNVQNKTHKQKTIKGIKQMVEIESGIPFPDEEINEVWRAMQQMEVSQSILVPRTHTKQVHARAHFYKIKVRTKKVDSLNIRVWRVK